MAFRIRNILGFDISRATSCSMKLVIIGVTGIIIKDYKNICKQYQESIQQIIYKKQLY
jgi:uncharacterized protein (UPF0262 family)